MMSVRALQEVFFDEVCDDLCVGLCGEAVALFDELPLQRNIVLDNSVVNHYHAPAAIAVRMGDIHGGAVVCCRGAGAQERGPGMGYPATALSELHRRPSGRRLVRSHP